VLDDQASLQICEVILMSASSPAPEWLNWWSLPYRMMAAVLGNPVSFAPQTLGQEILPGWTFANTVNVTEENSNSPETERSILQSRSYGQQLGKVLDAVNELIKERPPDARNVAAFQELSKLWRDIEDIKSRLNERHARRIEQAVFDLAELKQKDSAEYGRLAAMFREVMDSRLPEVF
jgi:hypothetical protein